MIKNMHRGVIHTGKVPAKLAAARLREQELGSLQLDLEKAVKEENFEDAASIRDRIRLLETADDLSESKPDDSITASRDEQAGSPAGAK